MGQIYLNVDEQLSLIEKWLMFSCGILFIMLPSIGNLMQLHSEIQVWLSDIYSKHTVQAWIRSYIRRLYMIAILFGSSFAAVDICNSNIFHLRMFNMGLNKRQQALFKNQRILSIVLFENIPQLILQIIYLMLTKPGDINSNEILITLFAMCFSTISIISSIFSYKSSSLFIACEAITIVDINIESKQLGNTSVKQFSKIIVHRRKPIRRELAKIICVNWRLIEILLPIQTKTGFKLIFYIRNNDHDYDHDHGSNSNSNEKRLGTNIVNIIRNEINSGSLAKVT